MLEPCNTANYLWNGISSIKQLTWAHFPSHIMRIPVLLIDPKYITMIEIMNICVEAREERLAVAVRE